MEVKNEDQLAEERSGKPEHISTVIERVMRELRKDNGLVFADKFSDDDNVGACDES
jgi:hypothetical protein